WYETVKLNYGVDYRDGSYCFDPIPNTWYKMLAILRFWAAKGIDAFRCDMVEMVPVSFWEWAIPQVKQEAEVLFIAEVYRPERYRDYLFRGGFDYLYDKVGLYDTLRAVVRDERPASDIGNCLEANADISPHMLHFLETHDEQRIASPFFAGDPFRAVPAMILAATAGTNPLMLYFGQELGETGMDEEGFSGLDGRTSIYDYWSLSTLRRWINGNRFDGARLSSDEQRLRTFYVRLFHITLTEPAFTQGAFYDLVPANRSCPAFDSRRHYAFFRYHEDGIVLVVTNFSDAEARVSIRIPAHAFETCQLPDNVAAQAIDLLTGETALVALTDVCPYAVTLPPHSGKLIKFYFQNKSSSFPTFLPAGSTCIN
ncbi:MAG: alpha-amylase, partial [Tannerellaceae bacterium]|nr:alpha-amylase [Tannerellaceae bacterium]